MEPILRSIRLSSTGPQVWVIANESNCSLRIQALPLSIIVSPTYMSLSLNISHRTNCRPKLHKQDSRGYTVPSIINHANIAQAKRALFSPLGECRVTLHLFGVTQYLNKHQASIAGLSSLSKTSRTFRSPIALPSFLSRSSLSTPRPIW